MHGWHAAILPLTAQSLALAVSFFRVLLSPRVVQELNDDFKGEDSDSADGDTRRVSFRRACLVISGAEGIGLAPLIRPRHITGKAHLYNIAFVAQLLNRRPRIHRESLHLQASVTMQVGSSSCVVQRIE